MKFVGPLISVEDLEESKKFYTGLMDEVLRLDLGAYQQFASGLTLQSKESMTEILHLTEQFGKNNQDNTILYFETERFDHFLRKLDLWGEINYIHPVKEYEWGQRSVSFYDPDEHPIDVSESMEAVFRRLHSDGMSIEQISAKTEHPMSFVIDSIITQAVIPANPANNIQLYRKNNAQ